MADLMSAALFERGDKVLTAHRRRPPFEGQWMLPIAVVHEDEAAEDALRRHMIGEFGIAVSVGAESFVETVYLVDPNDQHRYVANIFRTPLAGGPMRFNAEGDYDDARWLAAADLEQVWMPPDLRVPLVKILTEPGSLHETDWGSTYVEPPGQGAPLAEAVAAEAPAPDSRAAWDAIAAAYQEQRYGERFGERLMWSWRASEDDLHVLDDVRGKRAIVLGCGGGQDVVALSKMGAVAAGMDQSPVQIEYAKKYAARHDAENASFVEGDVEDLSRFDDESFDLAVSIHVLDYVEGIERALAEAARVLKSGGVLAIAVKHPFDVIVDGGPPYTITMPYWSAHRDSTWRFKEGVAAPLRLYVRTMARWFQVISDAGFAIERLVEPREDVLKGAEDDELNNRWLGLMPYTLVIKARKR
jgi:ubiquinone/menaquinone biosynthesis C-methylase UbiE/ADP-ribose pyrophosphatase YjhB (NUDIX family)